MESDVALGKEYLTWIYIIHFTLTLSKLTAIQHSRNIKVSVTQSKFKIKRIQRIFIWQKKIRNQLCDLTARYVAHSQDPTTNKDYPVYEV